MTFEYKACSVTREWLSEQRLNEMGTKRWQLVAVFPVVDSRGEAWKAVFMRRVVALQNREEEE